MKFLPAIVKRGTLRYLAYTVSLPQHEHEQNLWISFDSGERELYLLNLCRDLDLLVFSVRYVML